MNYLAQLGYPMKDANRFIDWKIRSIWLPEKFGFHWENHQSLPNDPFSIDIVKATSVLVSSLHAFLFLVYLSNGQNERTRMSTSSMHKEPQTLQQQPNRLQMNY